MQGSQTNTATGIDVVGVGLRIVAQRKESVLDKRSYRSQGRRDGDKEHT